MDVIIYSSLGSYSCPYGRNLLSEMGKKNIIYLPDYSGFDAIIVLPNTFDIYGMDMEFYSLVKKRNSLMYSARDCLKYQGLQVSLIPFMRAWESVILRAVTRSISLHACRLPMSGCT